MTPEAAIDRARSQVGRGTVYRLGGGKTAPLGDDCRDDGGACDCSAFVCWVMRLRKYQEHEFWWLNELNGGWLNTDGIWTDARGLNGGMGPVHTGNFEEIEEPEPGCLVVYPSSRVSELPGPKVGHAGIVSQVANRSRYRVIHCSSGNYRAHRDAIAETWADIFEKREATLFARASSVRLAA